jgi:hypothetical protein
VTRRHAPGVLVALALVAGCDAKKSGSAPGAPSAPASASATTPAVLPGCHAALAGGSVTRLAPATLSIAVAKGKALVVSTVLDEPADAASLGRAHAERVVLGKSGAPEGPPEAVQGALAPGAGVSTFASAVVLGGELSTLAYGVRRTAPAECGDGALVATGARPGATRREIVAHVCRPASMFRAAAHGDRGIAFADGAGPGTVDAWLLEGPSARLVPLEALGGAASTDGGAAPRRTDGGSAGAASVDAPSVSVGAASVAAAYVVVRGATRQLRVARLASNADAKAATIEVLEADNVGTVSTAFEDDTLHVVWSSFVPERNRYVLRWSKWPAGGSPSPPQSLGTGVLSAFAPALAVDRGRFLLAWAEGDAKSSTVVKVGASKSGLAFISGVATVVSTRGVDARAPVVALEGDAAFVAWKELGHDPEVRASAISCHE